MGLKPTLVVRFHNCAGIR